MDLANTTKLPNTCTHLLAAYVMQELLCEQKEKVGQQQAYTEIDPSCVGHSWVSMTKGKGQQGQAQEHQPYSHSHGANEIYHRITLKRPIINSFIASFAFLPKTASEDELISDYSPTFATNDQV